MKSIQETEKPTGQYDTRTKLLLYFLEGSKRYFALAVVSVCLMALFELLNPKLIGYVVDFVIDNEEAIPAIVLEWIGGLGGRAYVVTHLWLFSGIVIAIAILAAASRYGFRLFNSIGAETLVKRMRDVLYDHIIHLPYSWHDVNKTGDIIQRCTSDVDMIKRFLSAQLTSLVRMVVIICLSLFFMGRIHLPLMLAAAAFIPVVVLYSFRFHSKLGASFEKVDTEEGKLSAIAQENLTGVRVVRAFGREKYERDRFETKNEEYTGLWVNMMSIMASFWSTSDLISGTQLLTVLALGSYFTVRGDMTPGSLVAFISYNEMLKFPVRQLGRVVSELSKAGVSIDRIRHIMNSVPESDAEDAADFPENGDIVFDHVSFAYQNEAGEVLDPVLKDLSFTIRKGETIGILGGTGSGKSTMIYLLDHLYELQENGGKITINGVDLTKVKKSELRTHIGMVLQEPYLFSRSLEDNIRLAKDDATHEDVVNAVETASLSAAIARFKDGYETYVGERGVTLSGGQKQRTAIAQMLIRQPEIMIFDDSLSAVDAQTDAKIRQGLRRASGDATTILISHRITTLMQADYIFVLEDGAIVEQGTHEELLAVPGRYHHIYDLQLSQGDETGRDSAAQNETSNTDAKGQEA